MRSVASVCGDPCLLQPELNHRLPRQLQPRVLQAARRIGGWDPTYRSFFPYWRSVLAAKSGGRVYPSYALANAYMSNKLDHLRVEIVNKFSLEEFLRNNQTSVKKALWYCCVRR